MEGEQMNVDIGKIVDAGKIDQERVIFIVKEDDFLGGYLVFKTKQTDQKAVSSKIEHPYWFPDKDVKRGDLVVLYTKKGINTQKKNSDETTTYFFYWNKDGGLWNNDDDAVLLMRLTRWGAKSLSESKK